MFVGLWPKKKGKVPVDDLKMLAEAFDTLEDPVLAMKGRSVKWGIEGRLHLLNRMVKKWTVRRLALPVLILFQSCWGSLRR
jgi:hypothetical protein